MSDTPLKPVTARYPDLQRTTIRIVEQLTFR
jgi:hypothetical protein